MEEIFLDAILKVFKELNGKFFFSKDDNTFHLGVEFHSKKQVVFDYLKLRVSTREPTYGVIIRTEINNKVYLTIMEYTYILVNWLQHELDITIEMKPFTAKNYFLGELSLKRIPNKN